MAQALGRPEIENMNTAMQVFETIGKTYPEWVAVEALKQVRAMLPEGIAADVVVTDRAGRIIARAGP